MLCRAHQGTFVVFPTRVGVDRQPGQWAALREMWNSMVRVFWLDIVAQSFPLAGLIKAKPVEAKNTSNNG